MTSELLRLRGVLAKTGLSRSAMYRLMAIGMFPKPISLAGTSARAWRADAIDEWIQHQAEMAEENK